MGHMRGFWEEKEMRNIVIKLQSQKCNEIL